MKSTLSTFIAATALSTTLASAEPNSPNTESLECGNHIDLVSTLSERYGRAQVIGWSKDLQKGTSEFTYSHAHVQRTFEEGRFKQEFVNHGVSIISIDGVHGVGNYIIGDACITKEAAPSLTN